MFICIPTQAVILNIHCNDAPVTVTYNGITKELTQMRSGSCEIDSLLSVMLEDKLPISVFDDCLFRLRMKINVDSTGYISCCQFLGDIDYSLKSYIVNVLKKIKFNPAIKNRHPVNSTMIIMVKLDFTKMVSDIKRNLFGATCSESN